MSGVTVHRNSAKPASVNAHAYTQGSDIYLGPGQERHLAHESWHVVQQGQGRVQPTMQMAGKQINDSEKLEKEADIMGSAANKAGEKSNHNLPAMVLPTFNSSGNVKQCKLRKWQNPVTKDILEGLTQAQHRANDIDNVVENGKSVLQKAVDKVENGIITNWADFKKEFSGIGGDGNAFVSNFTNKLNDYRFQTPAKKVPKPDKEAGYIIEEYVTTATKGDADIKQQYVLGGS
ncbi:MAG: DUF4157 domain-containing protein, partial [bacterium]|nr:DUF4157 domain-containing protein [bacterium]